MVREATGPAARAARERIGASLERAVQRGRLDRLSAEAAPGRISTTVELTDLADRHMVIEDVQAKTEVFTALDRIVADPAAILATNTSSLPVMRLGMATGRADRVVGPHFFNPVPVLPLVEVVTTLHTSTATVAEVTDFATNTLGRTVVRSEDGAGFVVNALLIPYLWSAIRMPESASPPPRMSAAVWNGAAPTPWARSGSRTWSASIRSPRSPSRCTTSSGKPLYAPPPLLRRMVEAGLLGRKTGRGFHAYDRAEGTGGTG